MNSDFTAAFLVGSLGAFIQELSHWYSLRSNLEEQKYQKLLKSPLYWIITISMILISGIGVWIWCENIVQSFRHYVVLGAAFPLMFKKAISTIENSTSVNLGTKHNSTLEDYLS